MEYQQICYARTGMQGVGSGWQTLNVSPRVSADAETAFSRVHAGSVSNVAGVSPAGRLCHVRELRADGPYVFLTMLTYGVPDQRRRPSAFAHGLVFDRTAFERDPQMALCVKDESFGYKAEDTAPRNQHIETAPPLAVAQARTCLGLTPQGYENLLTCVYEALGAWGASVRPFEVECDCAPETVHALLTCIYQGLPLGMRARFSFSTMATNRGMPASMVVTAKAQGRAFVLATGEVRAGAFGPRAWSGAAGSVAAPSLYPVCALPARAALSEDDLAGVYAALEQRVETFCDPGTAGVFAYQLAFEQMVEKGKVPGVATAREAGDNADLVNRLKGCLALEVSADAGRASQRDELLGYALGEIVEHGIELDAGTDQAVARELARTQLDALKDTGFAYNVQTLARKTPEEGAAYLERQYPDADARASADFLHLRSALEADASGNGAEIVAYLYKDRIAAQLAQQGAALSLDALVAFHDEVAPLADARITSCYVELCARYARLRVVPNGDPAELVSAGRALFDRAGLSTPDVRRIGDDLLAQYWEQFDFSSYGFVWEPYNVIAVAGSPECAAGKAAAQVVFVAANGNDEGLVRQVQACAQPLAALEPSKRENLRRGLMQAVLRAYGPRQEYDLGAWYAIADVLADAEGPVVFLLQHGMLSEDRVLLEPSLERTMRAQGLEMLERVQAECERLSKTGVPVSRAAGAVARGIRSYLKRVKKEERRSARGGGGGVFGKFRRAFGTDDGQGVYGQEDGYSQGAYRDYGGPSSPYGQRVLRTPDAGVSRSSYVGQDSYADQYPPAARDAYSQQRVQAVPSGGYGAQPGGGAYPQEAAGGAVQEPYPAHRAGYYGQSAYSAQGSQAAQSSRRSAVTDPFAYNPNAPMPDMPASDGGLFMSQDEARQAESQRGGGSQQVGQMRGGGWVRGKRGKRGGAR